MIRATVTRATVIRANAVRQMRTVIRATDFRESVARQLRLADYDSRNCDSRYYYSPTNIRATVFHQLRFEQRGFAQL